MQARATTPIREIQVGVYRIPTETPEADGTCEWDHTTLVLVEATAANQTGIGYSYASVAAAALIRDVLAGVVEKQDAMDVRAAWDAMCASVRNLGRPGIAAMAISAVDSALWDLKARLLGVPLVVLLGAVRETLPLYGSGGFTNFSRQQLQEQLGGWVRSGLTRVKMKIGRDAKADRERVTAAREAIGRETELFVDANGAYSRKLALAQAEDFRSAGVSWFEEPVSSDDLEGLRLLRDRAPATMDIAAGEYGFDANYFRRMLEAGAVDVLQADATRCCGITGFLQAAALCDAFHLPLSSHCAPALHVHPGCAVSRMIHAEYFADHVRIEQMLFDGLPRPENGTLRPDLSRSGNGLVFKRADAARYECSS
jgi:L-alanine-DL-glutamate epimerase-like enolase superfamily enzyme